jgi:mannan endo-1,4-beta-mannosidase
MNYLVSQYGEKTFSGQQHSVSDNLPWPGNTYLSKSGGMIPAIRGSDFIDYSPTRRQFGENPNSETEQTIQWAQQTGGLVTMMWHWNAPADLVNAGDWPWWRGFYTQGTTFDLPAALANPQSEDYQFILRDIDAIAVELQKFQSANIPVIWRPLHEAQGEWFWWGAHGPDTFKDLWNLMHDRLTNVHGLHNLIWEYTSTGVNDEFLDWYPGDDVVDMIGADIYTDPSSSMSGEWYDLLEIFNGRKMIALSETGTLPNPDLLDLWNINWSYFSPWNGTFVDAFTPQALQAILGDEDVITLDELLATPWKQSGGFLGGDLNFDGEVIGDDLAIWQAAYGETAAGDVDLDGDSDGRDFLLWMRQYSAGLSSSTAVPEPASVVSVILLLAAGGRRRSPTRTFPRSATTVRHSFQANAVSARKLPRCFAA